MRALFLTLTAAIASAPALAQQPGVPAPEAAAAAPQQNPAPDTPPPPAESRVNQVIVYGDDPCPESSSYDEIVVCARLPDDERYRIPPNLRQDPNDPVNQSWANRAIELSYVGASGIGSCSPAGAGGFTGCFNQLVRQARAERAGRDEINWNRLIEEAREERLRRIEEERREEDEADRNLPD